MATVLQGARLRSRRLLGGQRPPGWELGARNRRALRANANFVYTPRFVRVLLALAWIGPLALAMPRNAFEN